MIRTLRTLRTGILLAAALAAPAPGQTAASGGGTADLLRTDAEFSDAAQKLGVAEAFVRYADLEAVMLPAGQDPVVGREASRKQMEAGPPGATLVWKPYKAEVSRSGDLGYTLGTYEARGPGKDGKPVTTRGKYCSVWKRQGDGSWKWVVDVGTPSPSPK